MFELLHPISHLISGLTTWKERRYWEEERRGASQKQDPRENTQRSHHRKQNDPGFFCRKLHLQLRRWGWKRECLLSRDWRSQSEKCDSGSLLSLLGQNRCEKKEGEEGRKEGERAWSTSHKFSLWQTLSAQCFHQYVSFLPLLFVFLCCPFAINVLLYCNKTHYPLTEYVMF